MLEVFVDRYGIVPGDMVLTSLEDYARCWDEIINSIANKSGKIIILKQPYLETYFQNLKEKFGNKIEIRQMSPHLEWENSVGFKLPTEIDEEEIANLLTPKNIEKLNETENQKLCTLCILSGVVDFSDFTTEESLMECILKGVDDNYSQLLSDTIDEIIKASAVGKREFWQRLKDERDKKETFLDAMKSYVMKQYPSDSMLFKKYYKESLVYGGFEFPARFSHYIDEKFKEEIKEYLSELMVKNDSLFISFISGKLMEEWDVVCSFLKENPIQDDNTISSLSRKASEYQDIYEEIQKYVPVSSPPREINEKNINDWIEKYFAFYLYTRQIGRSNDTDEFVKIFEDFILKHYSNSTDFFTQHSILTIRRKIEEYLKTKQKLLLLVVDGLSYAYHKEMERIFGVQSSFIFSTLPTVTEINKQRILSGFFDEGGTYKEIIEKFYGKHHYAETNSDKMNLKDFLRGNYDLYIYWENQFDSHIHRPMTFEKRFGDHVKMLIEISEDVESFLGGGGIALIIGDHGYTTLPQSEDNKIVFSTRDVNITHNRVLVVKNEDNEETSPIENVYWVLDNIAIAHSYHYFNSLPRGATHGGATPEEMVVPFFIIEKEKVKALKMFNFNLSEEKYLRKKKHITNLIINNPNVYDVQVISLQFKPQILKVYSPIPLLLKSGKNSFEAELDLRPITTEDCKVFVEYKVKEKVYQDSFIIYTRGAITESFDKW